MEDNVTLSLPCTSVEHASRVLNAWKGEDEETTPTTRTTKTGAPSNKAGKNKIEKKANKVDDDDDVEVDEDEELEDEESEETEDDEDDAPKVSFEQVVKAFKKYTASFEDVKKARAARTKILTKFKVEQPSELNKKDYPAVMKLLKVKN